MGADLVCGAPPIRRLEPRQPSVMGELDYSPDRAAGQFVGLAVAKTVGERTWSRFGAWGARLEDDVRHP